MDYRLLDIAFAGLVHDIGKFYQRTMSKSDLNEEELTLTKFIKNGGYYAYLHSGYTSRFLRNELNIYNELEMLTSEHHKGNTDVFSQIISKADHYASAIDRKDEDYDSEKNNKRGKFITSRLYSVLSDVHFGGKSSQIIYPLSDLTNITPVYNYKDKDIEESTKEYKNLFDEFIEELHKENHYNGQIDMILFHNIYNLFNKYLVTIPASTYGNVLSKVSLYDHLKLTSAIASCLYNKTCRTEDKFIMLEIDISGIQSFIYQITEGSKTKQGLTKSLRGRSALVGLISNAISYAFLNEFGLTQSNILFNTGGGSMILFPYDKDVKERIEALAIQLKKSLFDVFQTDITFVYAFIELNSQELEEFQSGKSIELKQRLGEQKMKKFKDIIDDDFFYEKIDKNHSCGMCGRINKSGKEKCKVCESAELISDIYTKYDNFGILYDFNHHYNIPYIHKIDFGFVEIIFIKDKHDVYSISDFIYIDSINKFGFGNQKMISNLVPLNNRNTILNFEEILKLTPEIYGDYKLAILKMDVDNLGGIFAFGLIDKQTKEKSRSISKFVTMSRLMEYFFGYKIKDICVDVSKQIREDIHRAVSNDTMFYINYAGGDDLVIMGSVYSIVRLSLEIYKRFKEFTGNEDITLSGGIHIQNDKKPIRFGILEAEKQLEISKTKEKNAVTIMDTRVPFGMYENLLNEVDQLIQYLNKGCFSRTMLYNIMTAIDDKSYNEYVCLIPRIQYVLYRNIDKTYEKALNHLKKLFNECQNYDDIKTLVLKLKLVILFTRDRD